MNQPYYVDSVDELCPSFKKLCIDNTPSNRWSIVQYTASNVFRTQSSDAIKDALKHKKFTTSQSDLIPLKLLIPNDMSQIVLTRLKDKPLTIVDVPNNNIIDNDNEYDMNVD